MKMNRIVLILALTVAVLLGAAPESNLTQEQEVQAAETLHQLTQQIVDNMLQYRESVNLSNRSEEFITNLQSSAPGSQVTIQGDLSPTYASPAPQLNAFVSMDNQATWDTTACAPLGTPGYDNTWECNANTPGGSDMAWFLQAQVNINGDTLIATQAPKNENEVFPPGDNLLATLATDPAWDQYGTPFTDILSVSGTYSNDSLYFRMQNGGGGYPLWADYGTGPFWLYGIGLVNPITFFQADTVTIYALGYAWGIYGTLHTGLLKVQATASGEIVQEFSTQWLQTAYLIGNYSYYDASIPGFVDVQEMLVDITGDYLSMAMPIAPLLSDPDFGAWPNSYGGLIAMGMIASVTNDTNQGATFHDAATPGILILETQFQSVNTAPVLSAAAFNDVSNQLSVSYIDGEGNLPVLKSVTIGNREVGTMTPQSHTYDTGAGFIYDLADTTPGNYTATFDFQDGAASDQLALDFTIPTLNCNDPAACNYGVLGDCVYPTGCNGWCEGDPGGPQVVDCAGVCGGTAVLDVCGVCDGPGLNADGCCGADVPDCAGVCGGTSVVDVCGVCNGPGLNADGCCGADVPDCAGVCGGTSVTDDCGDCVLPADFNAAQDCAGVCNGTAYTDDCGVCDNDPNNDNACYGCTDSGALNYDPSATIDDGSCTYPQDVTLYFGAVDEVNNTIEIWLNNPGPLETGGFQFAVDGATLVSAAGGSAQTYGFFVSAGAQVLGVQIGLPIPPGDELLTVLTYTPGGPINFCLSGAVITSPAPPVSFGVNLGPCYIPGCTDNTACNYDSAATVDDGSCIAPQGCNDWCAGDAGAPETLDCASVCGGTAVVDVCGVCDGPGLNADGCCGADVPDCAGVCGGTAVVDVCGVCDGPGLNADGCCGADVPDCAGVCGGTAVVDVCGVCDGPGLNADGCCGADVPDCAGVCGGTAVVDVCGVCDGPGLNADGCCGADVPDCAGVCGGTAVLDVCGVCDGPGLNADGCCGADVPDCAGVCGGTSVVDECGVCDGPGILPGECDCAGNILDECGVCGGPGLNADGCCGADVPDCAGVCGGTSVVDECGVCDGPGILPGECDCAGNILDECGVCGGPGLNADGCCGADVPDCAGVCGGTAVVDVCGVCDGPGLNADGCCGTEVPDCFGDCGGIAQFDACGICAGPGLNADGCCGTEVPDCFGDCGGTAVLDACGVCDGPGLNADGCCGADVPDCFGDCGGTAVIDVCGICGGPGLNADGCCGADVQDCFGDCGGTAVLDECGVCDGPGILPGECDCEGNVLDCNGECGGTALTNECGCYGGSTGLAPDFCYGCLDPAALDYDPLYTIEPVYPNPNDVCAYLGDFNNDDQINVTDVVEIVGFIQAIGTPTSYQLQTCDLNGDGLLNVVDLVTIIDTIVNPARMDYAELLNCSLITDGRSVRVQSDGDVAGVQLSLDGDYSVESGSVPAGWQLFDSNGEMILLSMTGARLNGDLLFHYTGDLTVQSNTVADWYQNSISAEVINTPSAYSVSEAYPNPFNPATTLEYSLPIATHLTLSVYNILGTKVADLVNDDMAAGNYTVTWNADTYPSGIYFIRFEAIDFTHTQKIILIK